MAEQINIKAILETTQVDGSLNELKQKFAQLEDVLGNSLLSPEETQKVLIRMGQLKSSVSDLEGQVDMLAQTNAFGDLIQVTTPLVGVLTAAGSATQLLGVENEKLNEIINQTTSLTIGLMAVKEIADAKAIKSIIRRRTEQISALVVDKLTFKNTVQQSAANTTEATTKGLSTIATKLATKAQIAWNAAITSNPIGLLIVGVAALVTGIYFLVKALDKSTDEFKNQKKAIDGTIFSTVEARDRYNELQFTLKGLNIEYQSIIGTLQGVELELAKLSLEFDKQITTIENEYLDSLKNLEEKNESTWRRIGNTILESIDSSGMLQMLRLKKQAEERIRIEEEYLSKRNEVEKINNTKRLNLLVRYNQDVLSQTRDLEEQITKIKQQGIDQRKLVERRKILTDIGNLRKSLEDITKAYSDSEKDVNDIISGIKSKLTELEDEGVALFYLDETGEQISELEREQSKFNDELKLQQTFLENITKNRTELINKAEEELDILIEKQGLLYQEKQSLQEVLNIGLERRKQIETESKSIKKSIQDNIDLFKSRLKNVNQEKLIQEGLIEGGEILLDTSDKQIRAQQLLLKEKLLEGDEVRLQSSLYEQLNNYLQEQVQIEQQLFSLQNQLTDENEKYNEITGYINTKTGEIAKYQSYSNEEIKKQVEALDGVKKANDLIVTEMISRIRLERDLQNEIDKTFLITQNSLNQDLISLRQKYLQGELQDEIDNDKKIMEQRELAIKNYYENRIRLANNVDEEEILTLQMNQELDELTTVFKDKWTKIKEDTVGIISDMALLGGNAFTEIFNRSIEQNFNQLNNRLEMEVNQQKTNLDTLKEQGLIDEQEYNDRLLKIEDEQIKRSNDLKLRQAKAEKQLALFQIAIDTAAGVAKALAQGGGLFGPGLAALVLAQGGIQASLVASQPLPEFEMGGLVSGKSHSEGGVPIEVEGNEYIVRKDIVNQPGMLPLLDSINQTSSNKTSFQRDDTNFIKELKETILGITHIPVTNLESDFTGVQRRVSNIENRSRF